MVQNADWGPPLWRILHTAAERLGRQPTGLLAADERRAWIQLLKVTEGILPCAQCRKHYGEWKKARPLDGLGAGSALRPSSREWLWRLHEAVNERTAAQRPRPTLEEVEALYAPLAKDLAKEFDALRKIIQDALLRGLLDGRHWAEWSTKLRFLRSLWSTG
jgi:hypothetical protein